MLKKNLMKLMMLLSLVIVSVMFTACGSGGGGGDDTNTAIPDGVIRIHYNRTSADYENMTLWLWSDTTWSGTSWPNGLAATGKDSFGVYYDVPLKVGATKIGFVPVNKIIGDASKDGGDHVFLFVSKYKEVYVFQNNNTVYIDSNKNVPKGIVSGEIISDTEIRTVFVSGTTIEKTAITVKDKDGFAVPVTVEEKNSITMVLKATSSLDLTKVPFRVTYDGITVDANKAYAYVDSTLGYSGSDLGATYNAGAATLKLWAPIATKVEVDLYDKAESATKIVSLPLTQSGGVWSVTLNNVNTGKSDLDGYYYQYRVTNSGTEKAALDPYAKSMAEFKVSTKGVGTELVGKAAIINPNNTTVSGLDYANLSSNWKREDAVIWEMSVRDLTSQEGLSLTSQFGTYSAFAEKLQYIKDLGVTHIQLMPIMSYYFGDESLAGTRETTWMSKDSNYNWGYDPQSYFAPEGMYATNRTDAGARIKELKELIKAIHAQGLAVTLDVVYNHTAKTEVFNNIYPGYYYRDGKNASYCGNDIASNNMMARKLIIDSLVYWTKEYKVDGFRFDLMGILDSETVQAAYNAVKAENAKTLFIGEGWKADSVPAYLKSADQDWMVSTDDVAVFSDDFRDRLKSGYAVGEGTPEFLTGGNQKVSDIFNNIKAQPTNFTANDPGDVVQYVEAHDNLTLHDVIAYTLKKQVVNAEDEIHKRIKLANTVLMTSQGIAFMHGGQEYGRTKQWLETAAPTSEYKYYTDNNVKQYFINNSYDSSDIVNNFDWDRSTIQNATLAYTKGLIALRNSTDAFRLGTLSLVNTNVILEYPTSGEDKIIAYSCKATNGDAYYVLINADTSPRSFPIAGLDTGTVIVDDNEAGITAVNTITGIVRTSTGVTVDSLTAIVIKK